MTISRFPVKFFEYIRSFLTAAACFLFVLLVLKAYECAGLYFTEDIHGGTIALRCAAYTFIAFSIISFAVLIVYLIIRPFSKKAALITSAAIFGIAVLSEFGLLLYSKMSGALLGIELIRRPFPETMQTIKSVMNIWIVLALLVIAACLYIFATVKIDGCSGRKAKKTIQIITLAIMVVSVFFIGKIDKLTANISKPVIENCIVNKTVYCLRSCISAKPVAEDAYDTDMDQLQAFMDEYRGRVVPDILFPLERIDDTESTLAPYFISAKTKPNIVILIVESLGREWSGDTRLGVSFSPFIDSLARHSLYWKNCLSTAVRSFGAVPSITGSVPHGPKGFQFGNMPAHNSLISILHRNGYKANSFYAGDFSFDGVYEYLLAQNIDYASTSFLHEAFATKDESLYTYWGYHDKILYKRSLEEIERLDDGAPMLNLIITISSHDNLSLHNTEEQQYYIDEAQKIIDQIPGGSRNKSGIKIKRVASWLYTDYAIRDFFKGYSQRADYDSTIFIITGDHSSGYFSYNRLGFFHVPLIIWSPMLKEPKAFSSIVTHNDITPTITALLKSNFDVKTPDTVQWVGQSLSTAASHFGKDNRILLLNYAHEVTEIFYDGYFYRNGKDLLYQVDCTMGLIPVEDKATKDMIINKLSLYKYINNYVYINDRLTKHPLYKKNIFIPFKSIAIDSLTCHNLEKKPSEMKPKAFPIIRKQYIAKDGLDKIKLSLAADVMIDNIIDHTSWSDYQMSLVFKYDGDNITSPNIYKDNIVKFINQDNLKSGEWYKINLTKEFDVRGVTELKASIYIYSQEHNESWTADNALHLKNINVSIETSKTQN
ncbi:MAG: sulfatase-like hydrolase/transferase [Bacteroidales bacterium]|nr:sulfatase-like hydrolase/transferase [Bacteroidales bacterium]